MRKHESGTTLEAPTGRSDQKNAVPRPGRLTSTKVHERHLARIAIVYVRQSTAAQMIEHRESLDRQYALTDYALALGWSSDRVLTIDEDLGLSGRFADGRPGFQRLLAEISMDHVGVVMGLEMSRLARSCKDWHHLLEVCAVFGTLLADQDGVYDPNDPNDRLLLGLRGTISEVELHTMRNRLVDKVVVTAQGATEHIDVAIHWKGGFVSQHAIVRRVQAYDQLRDFDAIMDHVRTGHAAGLLSAQIAEQLQQAGFRTINPELPWDKHMVLALLRRSELLPGRIEKIELAPDEWLLSDLARHLDIGVSHLRRWMFRKGVHWRRSPLHGYYIIWADADEQKRLRKLQAYFDTHPSMSTAMYPKELTTPKRRPSATISV